nr:MAG TPA: putative HD superfamily hydrolase [Caudoviricetes sp.]
MQINPAANKERFVELATKYIKRDGLDKLLRWLDSTDFYTAPASTKYHLSVEGGLCQHSLNVFDRMVQLCNVYFEMDEDDDNVYNGATTEQEGAFDMENIAIVALFHDICKANCYVRDFKNVKVNGKWEQQEYWKWDEQFVYGHGSKSVYMLQQFMRLYIDEAHAIRFHMGGKEDPLTDTCERQYAQVYEKSKFAVLLHLADMTAAWLDESSDEA